MVSDNRTGSHVCMGQSLSKEGFRTGPIAFVTHKYIDDLSVLIYRAI